ncbi:MAG: glycosyltransferase [Bacteroidota bacterium]
MTRSIVIVIGMHRSGTSAITGLLADYGLNPGAHLLQGTKYNLHGYFENPNIVKLNDELLEWSQSSWDIPYFIRGLELTRFNEFSEKFESILLNDFRDNEEIIIKDPRISILLPWYKQYFKNNGIKAVYVCALRNPLSIMTSLQKRNGFSFLKSQELYYFYMCRILNYVLNEAVYFVKFENILKNTEETTKPLLNELRKHGYKSLRLEGQGVFSIDSTLGKRKYQDQTMLFERINEFYLSIQKLATHQFIVLKDLPSFAKNNEIGKDVVADIARTNIYAYSRLLLKSKSQKYIEPISHVMDLRDHTYNLVFNLERDLNLTEINWNPIIGFWNKLTLSKAVFINLKEEKVEATILNVNGVELGRDEWRFETGNPTISFDIPSVPNIVRLELRFTLTAFSQEDIELSFHKRSNEFKSSIDKLNTELESLKLIKTEYSSLKIDFEKERETRLLAEDELEKLELLKSDYNSLKINFEKERETRLLAEVELKKLALLKSDYNSLNIEFEKHRELALLAQVELEKQNLEVVNQNAEKIKRLSQERNTLVQDLKIIQQTKRRLDEEKKALVGSLSYQIGRFLTWPFRIVFDLSNRIKIFRKGTLLFKMTLLALSKPRELIANLNISNLKTLFRAIKHEDQDQLKKNFIDKLGLQVKEEDALEVESTYMLEERTQVHIEEHRLSRSNIALAGWVRSMDPIEVILLKDQQGEILRTTVPSINRPDVILAKGDFNFPVLPGFEIDSPFGHDVSELSLHVIGPHEEELCVISWRVEPAIIEHKREPYQVWQERNTISDKLRSRLHVIQNDFKQRPLFSVVMPVYNVDPKWLGLAVESIKSQIYGDWELILVNDASDRDDLNVFLEKLEKSSDKINLISRKVNGNISAATNDGIAQAKGDFIVFMDQDDELTANALFEFALAINKDQEVDLIYSDEDKIDESGCRYDPWFKPDWSPELLLSYNYINHLCCIRRQLVLDVGMLKSERDGCQDFDLLLRVTPHCSKIYHVPKVLYHWRALPNSIAGQGDSKTLELDFFNKGKAALETYLDSHQIPFVNVNQPASAIKLKAAFYTINFADDGPLASIIIPTKNQKEILKSCLESLKKTSYKNYEIIVANNASDDPETVNYLESLKSEKRVHVLRIENRHERFSFSQINNDAVKQSKGDFLVFLNDDTEVINPKWLSSMVGFLQIPGVGITGAKLLYPDNSIQHAGVLLKTYPHGYKDLPDHAFKNHATDRASYGFYTDVTRNYAAVTAACLGTSRSLFDEVGGFDDANLRLAYNDIDFCLKAIESGSRVVYLPEAELYHHESKSRGSFLNVQEVVHYKKTWRNQADVYYNNNFSGADLFHVSTYNSLTRGLPKCLAKVLFVSHNLNLEGAPLQLLEVIIGLQKLENWTLCVLSPSDGPLKNRYQKAGIDVKILPSEKEIDAFFVDLNPDVVVANTLVSYNYILAAERLGIPSNWVIHESSHPEDFFAHVPAEEQERIFYALKIPYSLIFVAKATRSLFDDFNIKYNHCVINNGLKTDDLFAFIESNNRPEIRSKIGVNEKELVILNLGTVCKRKGQIDFVQAAIRILDSGVKNVRFILVGARRRNAELVYLEEIMSLIEKNHYEAYFDIIDETPQTFQYFLSADLFVCSSYNESYPRVILEAMAFGLPIVSTPVFGIIEQLIEGQNCKYYSPGDVETLVNKIGEFIHEPITMKQYGKNSRAMLELITSYDEMIQQYSERIEEAIFTELN